MRRFEVEAWAHRIMDQLVAGQPTEDDSFVELKSDWPTDLERAARRIAGHANAARQQPILWLIGVDEKAKTIRGATAIDSSAWYDSLRSQFADGWAPAMSMHNIPREGVTVVALIFNTEGVPFVVLAPNDRLEIPWRSATAVRSARRSELFAILSEPLQLPEFHILKAGLSRSFGHYAGDENSKYGWSLTLELYITPKTQQRICIPFHKVSGWSQDAVGATSVTLEGFHFQDDRSIARDMKPERQFRHIETDQKQVTIAGPGHVTLYARARTDEPIGDELKLQEVHVLVTPAGSHAAVVLVAPLQPHPASSRENANWMGDFSNQA